jgi:hypothetical protein
MKPGDVLEGPVPYVVCATINDLDQFVTIPKFIVDGVTKASGLTPRWPLGVFAVFTAEGVTIAVYGCDNQSNFTITRNTVVLSENDNLNPPVGDAVLKMWKELRDTPEETLSDNYQTLRARSHAED